METDLVTNEMDAEASRTAINGAFRSVTADLAKATATMQTVGEKAEAAQRAADEYKRKLDEIAEGQRLAVERGSHDPSAAGLRQFIDGDSVRLFDRRGDRESFAPGLLSSRKTYSDWHREAQEAVTDFSLVDAVYSARREDSRGTEAHKRLIRILGACPDADVRKRIFGGTNTGSDWKPTQMLMPELDRAVGLAAEGRILGLFPRVEFSTAVYTSPILSGAPTVYRMGVPAADPAKATASDVSTTSRTKTPQNFIGRVELDRNSVEDSVIDARPEIVRIVSDSLTDAKEDAVINADTGGSTDAFASWNPRSRWDSTYLGNANLDHRLGFIGLRAMAYDDSNTLDMGSLQTIAGMLQLRSKLVARSGRDTGFIVNEQWLYLKLMALADVLNVDKKGDSAAINSGMVDAIANMVVIPSYFMTDDLAATGLYTGSGAKAGILSVDFSQHVVYQRRGAMVEMQYEASRQSTDVVFTERYTFDRRIASQKSVAYGFNLL